MPFSRQWSSLVFVWFWSQYSGLRRQISSVTCPFTNSFKGSGDLSKVVISEFSEVECAGDEFPGLVIKSMFYLVGEKFLVPAQQLICFQPVREANLAQLPEGVLLLALSFVESYEVKSTDTFGNIFGKVGMSRAFPFGSNIRRGSRSDMLFILRRIVSSSRSSFLK